jgi:hypothetical protein
MVELGTFLVRQYRFNSGFHRRLLDDVLSDLGPDELNWQPGPGHHSIWHNVWHMFLSNDYYFADAFETPPVWESERWAARLDLHPMARAFEMQGNAAGGPVPKFVIADVPDSLVDDLKAISLSGYLQYVDSMLESTARTLSELDEERLKRPMERYGLISGPAHIHGTGFSHVARHIGMIETLKGLLRGPGGGTASI